MKSTDFLTELSTEKLAQYKTAAGADATKADKAGDFKRGDKRFKGINTATKKQFDNDAKKVDETVGLPYPGTYEETNDMFKSSGQRRVGTLTTEQGMAEDWSKRYKSSINCSHPKGFSQKAHCAGKKKHNESIMMEMTCEDCGMCQTHGDHSKDNLDEACWKGYHKEGNKKMFGKTYPNCVKNTNEEQLDEKCWDTHKQVGMKNKGGRMVPNCVPKEGVAEGSTETTQQQQVRAAISKGLEVHKQKGDAEYKTRLDRSNKVGTVPGHYFDNTGYASDKLTGIDSIDPDGTVVTSHNDTDAEGWVKKLATLGGMSGVKTRALQSPTTSSRSLAEEKCPHCGGEMVSEELMNEKKDACYYKVKSRYKVWPSAYASGALVKCRNKGASNWGDGGKKNESSILEGIQRADESLHDWFNKEKWVRMDTKGNIKGPCAKEPGEGKPKCLPQSKAHSLGKKGRASAAARKRREDPNPDRSGKAINVNTKKKTKG